MPRGTTQSPKRRYLTLLEVADLCGIDPALPRRARRLRVQRLFQSFEGRDQAKYLHQHGSNTSPMLVCVDDLHLLDPWSPSTVQAIRQDVTSLADSQNRLKKRLKAVEDFAEKASNWMRQLDQTGSNLDRKPVH